MAAAALGKLVGLWKLEASDNFDEYMKAVDIGLMTRKLGATTKPNVRITVEGDEVVLAAESSLKNHVIKFKLGQEFQETTADGRKATTTITVDGGKLVQKQGGPGVVESTLTRYLEGDDAMICWCEAKGVVSKRTYSRVE